MADSMVTDPQNSNSYDLSSEFNSLPMPPLDPIFLSEQINCNNNNQYFPDLDLGLLTDDIDFDFNFDLTDDFFVNDTSDDQSFDPLENSGEIIFDLKPEVVGVLDEFEISGENSSDSVRVFNPQENSGVNSSDSVRDSKILENSGENSSNSVRVLNSCSHDGSFVEKSQSLECAASPGPVSSQGSGSPGVSSKSIVDVKSEEIRKPSNVSKRKKEDEHNSNLESTRNSKFRRSLSTRVVVVNDESGEDEKKKARLVRNRESAQLSRQRKKHYVEELEDKLRAMHSTVQDLSSKISYFMAENANLRQQLTSGGGNIMSPQPPYPGMYPPHPSMVGAYPWMPPGPYMVKSQGSQVPLVPIPRLKPQQPLSAPKLKKSDKENKKTKKVASISFLGLLFFMLLFGGLVPMINVKYGGEISGVSDIDGSNRLPGQHFDRIFTVNGHANESDYVGGAGMSTNYADFGNRISRARALSEKEKVETGQKEKGSRPLDGTDPIGCSSNSSEPLVASLYVPRNDKLVKIDGNLIIQSVMASEKAMASTTNNENTGLAIAGSFPPALAYSDVGRKPYLYRSPTERPRALTSGSTESEDGKMQQWFREGLAGPMLSSGICTEVFHFEVSPEAIVSASSPSPNSTQTHLSKARNRRFLGRLPLPFNESTTPNVTEEHGHRTTSQKLNFDNNNTNKSVSSSMVVSVLVDPREVGDSDSSSEGIGQKSLPRIFVVVLLDSVKYVTYSCMLPFKGSGPHLVTK